MSMNFSYNNPSVYYNQNSVNNNVKTNAAADVNNEAAQNFNFEKLNESFAKDGLEALQKELEKLQSSGTIDGYSLAIDISNNKQVITVNVGGMTYNFVGIKGESVAEY